MAEYLESFIESTATLPTQLYKNLNLMRELDQQCSAILTDLHGAEQEYIEGLQGAAANADDPPDQALCAIKSKHERAINLSDEKLHLAVQTYDAIDRCIRRLDDDLKRFEVQLSEQGHSAAALEGTAVGGQNRTSSSSSSTGATGAASAASNSSKGADMPIDPDEPVYCYCRQVSYGEMVQCDSPSCQFEWFHFQCVGLQTAPKGKWYCTSCQGKKHRVPLLP